jgi:hypothetical protein
VKIEYRDRREVVIVEGNAWVILSTRDRLEDCEILEVERRCCIPKLVEDGQPRVQLRVKDTGDPAARERAR